MSFAVARVDVTPMARLFKALGDETRLRLVALLAHGELCVCHVEAALGLSQPNASRHLAILKAAGIVEHRRDKSWVYYRLARQRDAECERQLGALIRAFGKQALLHDDVARLIRARGPGACK
jgi:ArsR family transcriptional regulator